MGFFFHFWTETLTASFCHSIRYDPQLPLHLLGSQSEHDDDPEEIPKANFDDEQTAGDMN